MFAPSKISDIERLLDITRSDSGISGPELAKAHIKLGSLVAKDFDLDPVDTTVVAIMRGGFFFAQGVYFELGCKFDTFDPKREKFIRPSTKNVILADSVVNTGNSLRGVFEPGMLIACCVANRKAVERFGESLHAARISDNSYVGANVRTQIGDIGPDTTMRLFNQI